MPVSHRILIAIAACLWRSGCSCLSGVLTSPTGRGRDAELARWLAQHPLPDGERLAITELYRTAESSMHVVQIRDREPPHVHARHDLVGVLHRGRGTLTLEQQTLSLREGDVFRIPKGTPHAFVNDAAEPAAAFVVFTPPFDGVDTVQIGDSH
jgi:quercetin dioxygenase-like cupin family protein